MTDKTANLMPPWPKGVSANPGGKTKQDIEIEVFAKLNAKLALQTLVKAMIEAPLMSDRINAAKQVLERAYGKPKEHVTIKHDRSITDMSEADLEAIIAAGERGEGTAQTEAGPPKPH